MSPPNRPRSTATPSASTDRSRTDRLCSRRTFIAAGSTTALVSLAGCSALADFLADMALQEVNVFNGADQSVSGTIEIVDPDDETVLEETFDLDAESDDESESTEATVQYDDVWTATGDYEVTVELDDPLDEATDGSSGDSENESNETNETNESESIADEELANESDDGSTSVEDGDGETDDANDTDGNDTDANDTDGNDTDKLSQLGSSKTDTVSIDDTDEQSLVIGIAQEEPANLISYHVVEDFSDLEDEFE